MKKYNIIFSIKTARFLTVLTLMALPGWVNAQSSHAPLADAEAWFGRAGNQIHFTENKGQIMQMDGQPATYVSHILQRGQANIYLLKEGGVAYQFNKIQYPDGYKELQKDKHNRHLNIKQMQVKESDIRLETYRMDMRLVGCNPTPKMISEGKSRDYTQYYNRNALNVHHYVKVTYKEVYPGIDWVIYTLDDGGMKYDFVVRPGGDPSQIRLRFTDQEELYLDESGDLIHGNRMGRFREKAPVSYQGGKRVASSFVLRDNVLSFSVPDYDPTLLLTIDPERQWGTYYGGGGGDFGRSCATDASGNVYLAGWTESPDAIATAGAHQTTYGEIGRA